MTYLKYTLLILASAYFLVAMGVALVVFLLGGKLTTALAVGFLIPFKWMGWF